MQIFALCARQFATATRRAAGISPVTSPPLCADTWWTVLPMVQDADFIYVDLHGDPQGTVWYGDDEMVTVTARQLRQVDVTGTVVFAANCYVGDQDSPMRRALFQAGARYVIAGEGRNYGPADGPLYGAPLVGLWLRRFLSMGVSVPRALGAAKRIAAVRGGSAEIVSDVQTFAAYVGGDDGNV